MSAIDNIISDLIGVSMAASSGVGNVNDVFKIRDDLRGLIAAALADAERKGAEAMREAAVQAAISSVCPGWEMDESEVADAIRALPLPTGGQS